MYPDPHANLSYLTRQNPADSTYYCDDCEEQWEVQGMNNGAEWEENNARDLDCPKCKKEGRRTL